MQIYETKRLQKYMMIQKWVIGNFKDKRLEEMPMPEHGQPLKTNLIFLDVEALEASILSFPSKIYFYHKMPCKSIL